MALERAEKCDMPELSVDGGTRWLRIVAEELIQNDKFFLRAIVQRPH